MSGYFHATNRQIPYWTKWGDLVSPENALRNWEVENKYHKKLVIIPAESAKAGDWIYSNYGLMELGLNSQGVLKCLPDPRHRANSVLTVVGESSY